MKIRLLNLFIITLFCFSGSAQIVWNGTTDTDWNTGGNWVGGVVPTIGDDVQIHGDFTVDIGAAAVAKSIDLTGLSTGSFAIMNLASGVTLDVTGDIDVGTTNHRGNIVNDGTITCANINFGFVSSFSNNSGSSLTTEKINYGAGSGSTFLNDGNIVCNGSGATISILNSGTFTNTLNGSIDVNNSSTASSCLVIKRGIFTNDGIITLDGSSHGIQLYGTAALTATNSSSGIISIGLSSPVRLANFYFQTNRTFTNDGTIYFSNSLNSSIPNIRLGTTGALINTGTVGGNTTSDVGKINGNILDNQGTISPGNSIGTYTISDGFTSTGTYLAELGSPGSPGTSDQLIFDGFSGDLSNTTLDAVIIGADPVVGNSYVIATGTTGTFSGTNLPVDFTWNIDYTGGDVTITVLTVLPVKLVSFKVDLADNISLLSWQTVSEINNEGFEVQRSGDSRNWIKIGYIDGNGISNSVIDYEYIDESPAFGSNYYRLKQIDFEGAYAFSDIVMLDFSNIRFSSISIYPNPTSNKLYIDIAGNSDAINIDIYNQIGVIVQHTTTADNHVNIAELSKGIYMVHLSNRSIDEYVKIVKE